MPVLERLLRWQGSRAGSRLSTASCKFQDGNNYKVLCSFVFTFVYDADSLFVSRRFATPKFKKEVKLFLQCHYLIIFFHSANHDADRRPLVHNTVISSKSRLKKTSRLKEPQCV